ncbi:MAG TPA: ABC transporter substrate-binding protein [Acidimicrobiales bacterium]|jgi:polar amino acid transport system substrate-binding protein|nr:ABC transporter substrate-binding protein [Acidimicrobiales bacterium]
MHKLGQILAAVAVVVSSVGWEFAGSAAAMPSPARSALQSARGGPNCTAAGVSRWLHHAPTLTVATESPAYPPWFVANDPANGQGFESAMTYDLARQLGIARNQVSWVAEPFAASFAPGPKPFDFDVDQISVTPGRARNVSFSRAYYQVDQALVARKGSRIISRHSPAQLRTYVYGAQAGTTGLATISQRIKPTHPPVSFATLDEAVAALQAHRIDAVVADGPTARNIASVRSGHSAVVGQLPTGEHYALAFQAHNPLVSCINRALATMQANGTLKKLERDYLGRSATAPAMKP